MQTNKKVINMKRNETWIIVRFEWHRVTQRSFDLKKFGLCSSKFQSWENKYKVNKPLKVKTKIQV